MKPIACTVHPVIAVFIWFIGCTTLLAVEREADGVNESDSNEPSEAYASAVAFLSVQNISEEGRSDMLETLQQYQGQSSWSGQTGNQLFAIVARRLPQGDIQQRAIPSMLRLIHAVAMSELLKTKAVLDAYAAEGLTDAAALRTAVGRSAEKHHVTGSVRSVVHQTAVQNNFAVGYVITDMANMTTHVLRPSPLAEVKASYRDTIHEQIRSSMEREEWAVALKDWQHLRELELTSESLYVAATRCLVELNRENEATQYVQEFLTEFQFTASPATLEQLGDLIQEANAPAAQDVATAAYRASSERLRSYRGENKK